MSLERVNWSNFSIQIITKRSRSLSRNDRLTTVEKTVVNKLWQYINEQIKKKSLSAQLLAVSKPQAPPGVGGGRRGGGWWMRDPAITDFRARGTIMGPAGLTAVFGMGTGGAPQVSSPEWGRLAVRRADTEAERHAGSSGRGEPRPDNPVPGPVRCHTQATRSTCRTERSAGFAWRPVTDPSGAFEGPRGPSSRTASEPG